MKHSLSVHYKELKNMQNDIANIQVLSDQVIAEQMSTAVDQDFAIKAGIKSTKATEQQHYTKLMDEECVGGSP